MYFIYTGKVRVCTKTRQGDNREVSSLSSGDVFGELAIFPGEVSPITTIVEQAAEIVLIPDEDVMQLIESNAQFSLEFSQFIEQRRKAMGFLQGIGSESDQPTATNGRVRSFN
ncbi:MAG: cyclic nucleotide-binding domain-containing protein [Cyanobacteria bacterium J06635_10]